jgi:hypothetical protein
MKNLKYPYVKLRDKNLIESSKGNNNIFFQKEVLYIGVKGGECKTRYTLDLELEIIKF